MSTPLADLVRRLSADGCSPETIAAAIEAAELHAAGARPIVDAAAERRRAADRLRKQEKRAEKVDVRRNSADENKAHIDTPTSPKDSPLEEEKGSEKAAPEKRARRLPPDFDPEFDPQAYALQHANENGKVALTRAETTDQIQRFRDHWRQASGTNSRKHDWNAALRNWIRRATDDKNRNSRTHPAGPRNDLKRAFGDLRAEVGAGPAPGRGFDAGGHAGPHQQPDVVDFGPGGPGGHRGH